MPLRLRRGAASRKRLAPPTAEPEGRDHPPPDVVEGNGPPDSQERGDLVGGEQVLASKGMSSVWWSGAVGLMLVRRGQGPFRSITPQSPIWSSAHGGRSASAVADRGRDGVGRDRSSAPRESPSTARLRGTGR